MENSDTILESYTNKLYDRVYTGNLLIARLIKGVPTISNKTKIYAPRSENVRNKYIEPGTVIFYNFSQFVTKNNIT